MSGTGLGLQGGSGWGAKGLDHIAGVVAEHLLPIDLALHHVRVDVHVHARILAELEQGTHVVLGQSKIPVGGGKTGWLSWAFSALSASPEKLVMGGTGRLVWTNWLSCYWSQQSIKWVGVLMGQLLWTLIF